MVPRPSRYTNPCRLPAVAACRDLAVAVEREIGGSTGLALGRPARVAAQRIAEGAVRPSRSGFRLRVEAALGHLVEASCGLERARDTGGIPSTTLGRLDVFRKRALGLTWQLREALRAGGQPSGRLTMQAFTPPTPIASLPAGPGGAATASSNTIRVCSRAMAGCSSDLANGVGNRRPRM